jgi:hypothetical protein
MFHHRDRLIKLERWIRIIAWLYLVGAALRIIRFELFTATIHFFPRTIDQYNYGRNIYWFRGGIIFTSFTGLLGPIFYCLVFFGVSYAIRYLLALKDTLQKQQLAQQE